MKMKAREEFAPQALREVWEWKDAVYQETKHLSTREALEFIHKEGGRIARQLKLPVATFLESVAHRAGKVAEAKGKYTAKRRK